MALVIALPGGLCRGLVAVQLVTDAGKCCGCRTCLHVCPKGAITMVEDACGFEYPQIDDGSCIECGLCLRTCAFQEGYPHRKQFVPYYGYAVRHKNADVMAHSRSGAAFVALSDVVLGRGGAIFGARFLEGSRYRRVVHACADNAAARDAFCGSKYVQSDLGDTFVQAKKLLDEGRAVLFSGTGCQIGALHKYLGREYDNLFTIDIVCHGVPPQKLWSDYLDWTEQKYGGHIIGADFRDKGRFGWQTHRETLDTKKASYSSRIFARLYSLGALRPSCTACVYCNTNRPGDITIADFWGHEKALGEKWDDDKGISLVLVNTEQGLRLWQAAGDDLEFVDCTGFPFRHTNLRRPFARWERYDEFWADYAEHGFDYCVNKYVDEKIRKGTKVTLADTPMNRARRRLRNFKPLRKAVRGLRRLVGKGGR